VQPFRLNKMLGYILIMVAVIFIPIGLIAINVADDMDDVEMGKTIIYIGAMLTSVFTMLVLGTCHDMDKYEKLGLLVFLALVLSATMSGFGYTSMFN
jgi:hypothetical protein